MLNITDILNVSDSFVHLEEFVDRVAETNEFQSLVGRRYEEQDVRKRIIAFYGSAGIGKTMLLDRLEFECIRLKIPYSRINFEFGTYNNVIEILRELVQELSPAAFSDWMKLEQYWFSSELDIPELNINLKTQPGGGFNIAADNVNNVNFNASGDMVAGNKVEFKNNTITMPTRAANDPSGAQNALTESFIKALGQFVQERRAVLLFEGLDHENCSRATRTWVDGLLDRVRVLKGFGVLPVVTYFNPPNFEAKLRFVTLRAELKPLGEEHVAEYFRARRIPENILAKAAKDCLEETFGIPARVYEYTENMISEFRKEIPELLREENAVQVRVSEEPQQVGESSQEVEARPAENVTLAEAPSLSPEPVEPAQENIFPDTILDELVVVEPLIENTEAAVSEELTTQMEELPAAQAEAPASETVPEEAALVVQDESNAEAEAYSPTEEIVPVDVEPMSGEVDTKAGEPLQPDTQLRDDEHFDSGTQTLPQEVIDSTVDTVAQPEIEPELFQQEPAPIAVQPPEQLDPSGVEPSAVLEPGPAQLDEMQSEPKADALPPAPPTEEEAKRIEDAFRRSQERLQQLKSEGKSSTANMVDSLLERQANEVAEIARRCAVLRWFTAELIGVIADQQLTPEQMAEITATLASWPFVQNFGYGTHAYRREVQQHLRTEMQNENPALYVEIHRRAQAYFEKQLGSVDTNDEMVWINLTTEQITALRENLYYLLHVDVSRGFAMLGKLFQSAQRLYMPGEAAILLNFANEVDPSRLSENQKNQLIYYAAVLEFAEDDAVSAESKLRALLSKPLEDELSAQVKSQLGVICVAGGRYDDAIKFLEQAQKIWKKLNRERELAKVSNNLGNVYMRKNDLGRAERSFNEALDGLKRAETPAEAALTMNNLGDLLSGLKKVGTASERAATMNKLSSIFSGLKTVAAPSERALTLNNLGNVYVKKENWSKALDYYQKSLEIKKAIGDQFGTANTFSNLGTVYQRMAQEASGKKQQEHRQQAVAYYNRSYETYRAFGARSNQGRLLFKLALLHAQTGEKANAKLYLNEALEIFRELEMPELENASKFEKQLA